MICQFLPISTWWLTHHVHLRSSLAFVLNRMPVKKSLNNSSSRSVLIRQHNQPHVGRQSTELHAAVPPDGTLFSSPAQKIRDCAVGAHSFQAFQPQLLPSSRFHAGAQWGHVGGPTWRLCGQLRHVVCCLSTILTSVAPWSHGQQRPPCGGLLSLLARTGGHCPGW
jgi:hypothetical protein